jgi:organic hydroperoxide reductase OsmC/OhrA
MAPGAEGSRSHHYAVHAVWSGSTAVGYTSFDRSHTVAIPDTLLGLELSGDAAFGGDPGRLNPEQLLVAAASSCQLLSFLAVAARARIDVLEYVDDGEGMMREDIRPVRLTSIVLRPRIRVAAGPSEKRVRALVEVAHRECYIANSLLTDVRVEPTLIFEGEGN